MDEERQIESLPWEGGGLLPGGVRISAKLKSPKFFMRGMDPGLRRDDMVVIKLKQFSALCLDWYNI